MALHLVRVIAGSAKGRRLKAPSGLDTRPMTGRAREALFSALGESVRGNVLDLYAGSGSLGIEALSRGVDACTFVERGRGAVTALAENLEATGFSGEVIVGDSTTVVARLRGPFDLVFVDPPFSTAADEVDGLLANLVTVLGPSATVVVHRRTGDADIAPPPELAEVSRRAYGDSTLWRFERT